MYLRIAKARVPAESEVRNAARPSIPGPSRPSGLRLAGDLGGPGTGRGLRPAETQRPRRRCPSASPRMKQLRASPHPPPPPWRRWRRPLGAQTSPAAHSPGATLRGLRQAAARASGLAAPLDVGCGGARRMAATRMPRRAVGAAEGLRRRVCVDASSAAFGPWSPTGPALE